MALISEENAQALLDPYPFVHGTAQNLLGKYNIAAKMRALKNYGCRFCLAASKARDTELETQASRTLPPVLRNPLGDIATLGANVASGSNGKAKPYKRSYTFDGMRSHLKAA